MTWLALTMYDTMTSHWSSEGNSKGSAGGKSYSEYKDFPHRDWYTCSRNPLLVIHFYKWILRDHLN